MKGMKKQRVDWTEQETQQFEAYLKEEHDKDPDAPITNLMAQAMQRIPADRRRSVVTSKFAVEVRAFLQNGTLLPNRERSNNPKAAKQAVQTTTADRVGDEAKKPSPVVITRMNAHAPTLQPKPVPAAQEPQQVTAVAPLLETVEGMLDVAEDRAVDFLVSVVDRVLRHPAVVGALHGLVRGAFEKDAQTAVDKTTATWTDKGPSARLPRVLVAGITPKDTIFRDKVVEQYKESLTLRFWDEQSQSRGHLKQLIHGSSKVIILTSRVSHGAFQTIKSRVKTPPIFVDGGNEAAARVLEELAKQSIIQQTQEAHGNGGASP